MAMVLERGPGRLCRRTSQRLGNGFTLLEVLIAMGLLAFVLLGVITLFSRSMASNVEGRNLTEVTNRARAHAEELLEVPYDDVELTVPDGETELVTLEVQRHGEEEWIPVSELAPGEAIAFSRRVRVRQFQTSSLGLEDVEFDASEAVPGGTSGPLVVLKEIVIWVSTGAWEGSEMLGRRKVTAVRILRTV